MLIKHLAKKLAKKSHVHPFLVTDVSNHPFCVTKTVNPIKPTGKLIVLPTPIGNMADLSPNIIKALFKADIIGCEDRRVAGKLYTLIKTKQILQTVTDQFGEIGLQNLIPFDQQKKIHYDEERHMYYDYANMNDKQRKKFLRKMTKQEQQKFKIQFLKYRAIKIMKKQDDMSFKMKQDKFDELYGLQSSDLEHIQLQIQNTRAKKGRGLLIPLNTYSETKMFDIVRMLLQNKTVAIVSDAGMPCISDPGWKMVRKIRQTKADVPIQVIGGPSSVSVMTLLASISTNKNSLSGRFQGFASQEISHLHRKTISVQQLKKDQFSIHFINSSKLRKKVIQLQKIFGENQQILIANQLTKLYQRKYHGQIKDLNKIISLQQNNQFTGVGEMSYLIYRKLDYEISTDKNGKQKELQKKKSQQQQDKNKLNQKIQNLETQHQDNDSKNAPPVPRVTFVSVQNFFESLYGAILEKEKELKKVKDKGKNTITKNKNQKDIISETSIKDGQNKSSQQVEQSHITSKNLIDLLCSVFGIKVSEARKYVYERQIQQKRKNQGLGRKQTKSNQGQSQPMSLARRKYQRQRRSYSSINRGV